MILSKRERRVVKSSIWECNPITFHVLGICSALAVTAQLKPALVMGAVLMFVLTISNTVISLLRNFIPSRIRIIVQLTVISSLVILADQLLKAFMYGVSKQLSIFIGLIITNCIIMGRAEGYAMSNPPWKSFLDGLGNALGYGFVLVCVASGRELLGNGTLLGMKVIPQVLYDSGYVDCGLMILAPGAFFLFGGVIWIHKLLSRQTGQ